uniref:Uncharacterized protein n=1 Tax=Mycolicibacterium gilvum (strain PYR-GCK) TaxID=350054 RepID=A4TCV4_MYCGI|nr:hypothetical protein Mflv_3895 [Mycolicibacterium gilvum PYR-GCK]
MTPKPAPFDCALCDTRIGRDRPHLIVGTNTVHIRCAEQRSAHNTIYPDCHIRWHDVWDHPLQTATRGGADQLLRPDHTEEIA